MNYYISKTIDQNFEDAIQLVTEKLKKLDVDFKKYKILGACNPNFAHQALLKEDKIGAMLPCNVIVEEHKDGTVEVSAVNPLASMQAVDNPELKYIADTVNNKLTAVIDGL